MGIAHVAIGCNCLEKTEHFYVTVMKAQICRRYDDRITMKIFDYQLVCHLEKKYVNMQNTMYPNHFGYTYINKDEYLIQLKRIREYAECIVLDDAKRFEGRLEEHQTTVIKDPSGNYIEIKWYREEACIY